ncbi:unnamed protein product [Lathyrus oleraceus]
MSLPCHVMSEKALESHSFSFYKQSSSFFSSSNLSSHSLLFHFQNLLLPLHCTIVRYYTFLPQPLVVFYWNHALLFLHALSHCQNESLISESPESIGQAYKLKFSATQTSLHTSLQNLCNNNH